MNRRELLRVLGSAGALPFLGALSVEELLAAGRTLHARGGRSGAVVFSALSAHEGATVTAIAEMIIPRTDTPGATDAGVPAFIDLIVAEWYTDAERAAFRAGLREVDARSRQAHGGTFIQLNAAPQRAVLEAMEAESLRLKGSGAEPRPFFSTIKWLTLYGYYTSQPGAVEELDYQIIPGRFDGCLPLATTNGG